MWNTHGGVLLLLKLQALSQILSQAANECNRGFDL